MLDAFNRGRFETQCCITVFIIYIVVSSIFIAGNTSIHKLCAFWGLPLGDLRIFERENGSVTRPSTVI